MPHSLVGYSGTGEVAVMHLLPETLILNKERINFLSKITPNSQFEIYRKEEEQTMGFREILGTAEL